jgi:hypothetical protein
VIFCRFSDGTSFAIEHDHFDYRIHFNLDSFLNFAEAADFDATSENALFLFFHNDNFELSDRDYYFKNCEAIIEAIKNNGNQRKVGMSLITKL